MRSSTLPPLLVVIATGPRVPLSASAAAASGYRIRPLCSGVH
jgi:hypothetical protein